MRKSLTSSLRRSSLSIAITGNRSFIGYWKPASQCGRNGKRIINDVQHSAPSKRIREVIPEYAGRKSTAGPDIAERIGIATIRSKCPHVHEWLVQLETIPWEEEFVDRVD